MKRKLKRAAVLLFLFIAVTNLLYLSFDIAADDAASRHSKAHHWSTYHAKGGCFLAPFLTALLTALTASPFVAEPPMHHSITDEGNPPVGTGNRALDGLGVFMFAFLCQVNSFEVYWDMSDRSASRFTLCSAIAMLLCFIVYGSTAVFGYLTSQSCDRFRSTPVQPSQGAGGDGGIHWLLVKLCASFPLISMPPATPVPQCWVGPRQAGILEALRRRRQSCRCCTALRPVHPQYQHGVWLHWLILWRCNGVSSSLDFHDVRRQLVAAVSWMGALHHHIRAALCRCHHGGVWHRCHIYGVVAGDWSAAQCGAPARLRVHGRQQACGVPLQYFAAVLGTLGAV
ncbi:hypothetical protein TcBrA4_0032630 [Trypanosoma cruzi]|nr:hypothetical protein TcBrA4_0032630 [Trypanosoma cruzi]